MAALMRLSSKVMNDSTSAGQPCTAMQWTEVGVGRGAVTGAARMRAACVWRCTCHLSRQRRQHRGKLCQRRAQLSACLGAGRRAGGPGAWLAARSTPCSACQALATREVARQAAQKSGAKMMPFQGTPGRTSHWAGLGWAGSENRACRDPPPLRPPESTVISLPDTPDLHTTFMPRDTAPRTPCRGAVRRALMSCGRVPRPWRPAHDD